MSWISPTGYNDPSSDWSNETNAYDDDTGTKATSTGSGWSGFLEFEISGGFLCNKVRFYAEVQYAPRDIDIDAYYDDGSGWGVDWHDVYQGSFTALAWVEKSFPLQTVTKARIRFNNTISGQRLLYEFDFWKVEPSAPGYGNCVGLWRMNDNAANKTVKDSSRKGNDGQAERNTEDLHATGKIDGALTFNGTSDYINCGHPNDLKFGTGDFSFAIWFKLSVSPQSSYPVLISKGMYYTNGGYLFYIVSNKLKVYLDAKGPIDGDTIVNDNSWHLGIVVKEGNDITLYLDSVFDGSDTKTGVDITSDIDVGIGARGLPSPNNYFDNTIDVVAIFDAALTEAEIAYLWNGGNGVEDLAIGRPLVGGSLAAGRRGLAG